MTTTQLRDVRQQALCAFLQELPRLWTERPGQWVAYQGDKQLCFAPHKHELYQQCFQRGLRGEEFVVFCIEPQESEIILSPVVLD